jgi:hypothetical protein
MHAITLGFRGRCRFEGGVCRWGTALGLGFNGWGGVDGQGAGDAGVLVASSMHVSRAGGGARFERASMGA